MLNLTAPHSFSSASSEYSGFRTYRLQSIPQTYSMCHHFWKHQGCILCREIAVYDSHLAGVVVVGWYEGLPPNRPDVDQIFKQTAVCVGQDSRIISSSLCLNPELPRWKERSPDYKGGFFLARVRPSPGEIVLEWVKHREREHWKPQTCGL